MKHTYNLMSYYERDLPHWQPEGAAIFITWCLHACYSGRRRLTNQTSGQRFAEADDHLHRQTSGPLWLSDTRVASAVHQSLMFAESELKLYSLEAWVIMPNHVHLLIRPKIDLNRITRAVKTYSARQANAILNRTGAPFWQPESYDHWVRDPHEFHRIIYYIEHNPVKAGLTTEPEAYRWSSAEHLIP